MQTLDLKKSPFNNKAHTLNCYNVTALPGHGPILISGSKEGVKNKLTGPVPLASDVRRGVDGAYRGQHHEL